jgi:hypothetical protein
MDCSSSCQLLDNFSGKLCFLFDAWISSDTLRLHSDAAGVHGGYAAVFGSNWFTGEWTPAIQPFHITIKELFPIVLAVVKHQNAVSMYLKRSKHQIKNIVCR